MSVTEAPTVALATISTVTTATETIQPRLTAKLTSVAMLSSVGVIQITWFSFLGYVAYRYLL